MGTHNFATLKRAVIAASRSNDWSRAVEEWQVTSVEEDPRGTGVCVCGNTGLVYLYTIRNHETRHELFPIGSVCVNLFEVEELNASVTVLRRLFDLRADFSANRPVALTSDHFSRAVLADLWENGAFPPNDFNWSNGYNDYKFLVNKFNQHRDLTMAEGKKVWVLLNRTIKDFVMRDERLQ